MNYKIIKGKFHVKGYSPDGDSIRFVADNFEHWDYFTWKDKAKKKKEKKQLRLEGIDALETHYEGAHQPRSFGVAAQEILLNLIGIKNIVFSLDVTKICSADDGSDGFIACSSLDIYDRPVSLLFPGNVNLKDGKEEKLSGLPVNKCVNLKIAKLGLVYPTFYSAMEEELLEKFTKVTKSCRRRKIGVWALDKTHDFTFWNVNTIQNDIIILPKLFRRLTNFLQTRSDFSQLSTYIKKKYDKLLDRNTGKKIHLIDVIEIKNRNIKFFPKPEDLIFDPKS